MDTQQLERIEHKVDTVHNIVASYSAHSELTDRLNKIETDLYSGGGSDIIISSAAIAQVLQSTNFQSGVKGWQIKKSGDIEANNIIARGTIYASEGAFTGVIYVGETGERIIIDGTNKNLRSENYATGISGWQLDYNGVAEFQNVVVRGELRATTLAYDEINVTAGSELIVKSAGVLLNDVTTIASPTTFNVDVKDGATHTQLFDVGDYLRIKVGTNDNWLQVDSVSDQTTFYRYVCTLENGTPTTFNAGTTVANYGASNQGGILFTADATNAPYLSVFQHFGSPWLGLTERVRLGNLNGSFGVTSDLYGVGFGTYSQQNYILMDATTPALTISSASGDFVMDASGIRMYAGGGQTNQLNFVDANDDSVGLLTNSSNPASGIARTSLTATGAANVAYDDVDVQLVATANGNGGGKWILQSSNSAGNYVEFRTGISSNFKADSIAGITVKNGTNIDEFSTDTTLAGNSDDALPTEKAVKSYVDAGDNTVTSYVDTEIDKIGLGCCVYRTTAQLIGNNTAQSIFFDAEIWDDDNFHSTASLTERVTIPEDGKYLITGNISWAANNTGGRAIGITLNGSIIAFNEIPAGGGITPHQNVAISYRLSAGDIIRLFAYQNSGAALNINSIGNFSPYLHVTRIGRY